MRVLVTRPQPQADEWVAGLGHAGIDAVALPLIEIGPAPDPAAVDAAWAGLGALALVVFVSPNAAARFFDLRPVGMRWPDGVLAASPGPGTSRVLQALGVPSAQLVEPASDSPRFDSEALWGVLSPRRDWRGAGVLVVRGDGGRDWLTRTLREHGAQVAHVAAYRRRAPRFDAGQRSVLDAAMAEPERHLWFFSSSEAIDHLDAAMPSSAAAWARSKAIATHPRIAQRALALGFGSVFQTPPTLPAVVACIQSIEP